jgi:hypothetical protein
MQGNEMIPLPSRERARPEDHFFTLANSVLYELFNVQSAFIGPTAAGPAEMEHEFQAQLSAHGSATWLLLLRGRGSFLSGDALAVLTKKLSRRIQDDFFPIGAGAMALLQARDPRAPWPREKPKVEFAMVVGSSALEVRIWKP